MKSKLLICVLAAVAATAVLLPVGAADARSSIRVGVADQSPAMFASPAFHALHTKITRYFVASDVMQNTGERTRARNFVQAARAAGISTLLHVSTTDLRSKRGKIVSPSTYARNASKLVVYFRKLGVRDFGSWDEVNHSTQETYNHPENAAAYFKSMWSAVHSRCSSCSVVGLDVLDQAGVATYIKRFYSHLSSTWRKRLKVVGIHNYSDVNRSRSSGTRTIIDAVRHYNSATKFWFTETGALAGFQGSFPYSESRQASRISNMFKLASTFKSKGVQRVYSYNWFGATPGGCGGSCPFDSGLVEPGGAIRPVYTVFRAKIKSYSR